MKNYLKKDFPLKGGERKRIVALKDGDECVVAVYLQRQDIFGEWEILRRKEYYVPKTMDASLIRKDIREVVEALKRRLKWEKNN